MLTFHLFVGTNLCVNTVELQWLKQLWDHEISSTLGEFEPVRVDFSARSGGIIRIFFFDFL